MVVVVKYCDMTHGRSNFPSQETIQDYCIRGGGGGGKGLISVHKYLCFIIFLSSCFKFDKEASSLNGRSAFKPSSILKDMSFIVMETTSGLTSIQLRRRGGERVGNA